MPNDPLSPAPAPVETKASRRPLAFIATLLLLAGSAAGQVAPPPTEAEIVAQAATARALGEINAQPAPQVIVVRDAQTASLESRINAWGNIANLALPLIFALAAYALKKAIELKPLIQALTARQDRQAAKTGSLQEQMTLVALGKGGAGPEMMNQEARKPGTEEVKKKTADLFPPATAGEEKKPWDKVLPAAAWLLVPLFFGTGCAHADEAFRSRVESTTTTLSGATDGKTTSALLTQSVVFRDPRRAGLAK